MRSVWFFFGGYVRCHSDKTQFFIPMRYFSIVLYVNTRWMDVHDRASFFWSVNKRCVFKTLYQVKKIYIYTYFTCSAAYQCFIYFIKISDFSPILLRFPKQRNLFAVCVIVMQSRTAKWNITQNSLLISPSKEQIFYWTLRKWAKISLFL